MLQHGQHCDGGGLNREEGDAEHIRRDVSFISTVTGFGMAVT
jgi:hypothetical protein